MDIRRQYQKTGDPDIRDYIRDPLPDSWPQIIQQGKEPTPDGDPDTVFAAGVEDPLVPITITPADVAKEVKADRDKKDESNMRRFSVLSKAAYDYYHFGYEKANKEMHNYLPRHEIMREFSDNDSIAVWGRDKNQIVLSFRGTQGTEDIIPDLEIATGLSDAPGLSQVRQYAGKVFGGRFNSAQVKYEALKKHYPDKDIVMTGHSLGGAQALSIARQNDEESYAFNPGAGIGPIFRAAWQSMRHTHKPQTIYTTHKDFISATSAIFDRVTDRVIHQPTDESPSGLVHSLSHFLPHKVHRTNSISKNWLYHPTPAPKLKWAKAGRSMVKFDELRTLCARDPNHPSCPTYRRRV